MGLVIPEQPAYKSHRRAVLIIETPDWGELKTLYCKNVLLPKMCFCMWKLTVSDLSPRFPRGGASIPGVQKNTKSEDSWAVYNFKIIWGGRKNNIILDMLHLLCLHLPCSCTISLHYICSSNICMRSRAFFLFLLPVHDDHCCTHLSAEVNISSYSGTRCVGIIFLFSCSCIQVRCLVQKYWSGTVMRNTECGAALDPMICIGTR